MNRVDTRRCALGGPPIARLIMHAGEISFFISLISLCGCASGRRQNKRVSPREYHLLYTHREKIKGDRTLHCWLNPLMRSARAKSQKALAQSLPLALCVRRLIAFLLFDLLIRERRKSVGASILFIKSATAKKGLYLRSE